MRDSLTFTEIAGITGGKLAGEGSQFIRHLATDSRTLPAGEHVLFLAIRGDHHDGNDYIREVYDHGIRCFLTDRDPGGTYAEMEDASFLVVKNSMEALHQLAAARRSRFGGELLAIAGSNGKTIVKEWIGQILQHETSVVRSPRSYNSQLGVPLSLWQVTPAYKYAIIEAGISRPGEMEKLEAIIRPDTGILTNIGPAHSENFSSRAQKLEEKLKLFRRADRLICRAEQEADGRPLEAFLEGYKGRLIRWTLSGRPAEYAGRLEAGPGKHLFLDMDFHGGGARFQLPFSDDASVENLVHVIVYLLEIGIPAGRINERLQILEPVEMRLETLKGIHHTTLVNDVYNSDLTGLRVALDVLMQQVKHRKRAVILSDVFQSGQPNADLYNEVSELLKFKQIDKIIGIGPGISGEQSRFPAGSLFFPDTPAFLQEFDASSIAGYAVLIKGARQFRFEEITRALQYQFHKTVLEINISEMVSNLNYFRSLLRPSTRIMVMVKALSYGAGGHEIAEFLQHEKIDYLAVAFPDEGIRLRKSGVRLPVMVMSADTADYRQLLENNLEPEIYSREGLLRFIGECRYMGLTDQSVHIKLDTGMHRLGFGTGDLSWLKEHLATGEIRVKSIFSHLAGSEDPSLDDFTHRQAGDFNKMVEALGIGGQDRPLLHLLNSSGAERFPEYHMDMVRIGIGLYGQGIKKALEPVSTFKTVISQIRELEPGETVGYGRKGVVTRHSRIATIPVGYADGIRRQLGNGKYAFWLNGKRVPTVGNICMDMTMLDVTGTGAAVGDPVELFGRNCPVEEMAQALDTIVYEILTSIPERVRRVYIRE